MKQRQEEKAEKVTLVCYNSSSSNCGPRWHIFEMSKGKVFGEELVWNPSEKRSVCGSYDLDHIDRNNLGFQFDVEELEKSDLQDRVEGRLGELCETCVNRFNHRFGGGVL